ncbi:MAG TPA: hypothetical protein VGG78_00180 [Gemmatimonadaceae bacterium]
MTARDRVVALRRVLTSVLVVRALLVATAAVLVVSAIARALGLPAAAQIVAIAVGALVFALLAKPAFLARSVQRVALWVEERHPSLEYALVTAVEGTPGDALERDALRGAWWDVERRRLLRTLVLPALAVLASVVLVARAPVIVSVARRAVASGATRGRIAAADPLRAIRATVRAPAYAGGKITNTDDPTSIDALVASVITISGAGDAAAVSVTTDSAPQRVISSDDGGWSVTLTMPARPAVLRFHSSSGRERLVVLAPIADAPPAVTLVLPTRDTVVRAAIGALPLRAQLRDDIGLRDAAFEIIISSGQDESFTFRTATLAHVALGGQTEGVLATSLRLDSLALKPGDVLQIRAVARDGNTATGPGLGSSETRALRVARVGEYDSVSVEAAPPGDPEGQVLSQRMLITLTEALDKRRPRLDHSTLLDESRRIAADQTRLRKRVGDVVFQRTGTDPLSEESTLDERGRLSPEALLKRASDATAGNAGAAMDVEGDETPILAVNKPLLEAFNAMWEAGRALEQGDTRQALPPMRRAMAAIERARQAERIYLRGRPSTVVVDVAHARLTGKEKGAASVREARPIADPVSRRRAETFARATALLATDPSAAADSLLLMRVGALVDAPALAAVLDTAARVARRGDAQETRLIWARLRRALGGPPVRGDGLPLWGAP